MLQTYPGAPLTYFGRVWNFSGTFCTKKCWRNRRKMVVRFFSWPLIKVELTCENGRNTSNTELKRNVRLLVQRFLGIASKTQMLLVKTVWVMPSVTGCHTLSTPIRKAKPNFSNGGTSFYIFAASFNGKNDRLYKEFVQNISWLFKICQHHDKNQQD